MRTTAKHLLSRLFEGSGTPGYDIDPASLSRKEEEVFGVDNPSLPKRTKVVVRGPKGVFTVPVQGSTPEELTRNAVVAYATRTKQPPAHAMQDMKKGLVRVELPAGAAARQPEWPSREEIDNGAFGRSANGKPYRGGYEPPRG